MIEDINVPVRINGALMGNYLNAKAIIMGYVTKVDADGKRASVKTTDEQFIQVVFELPAGHSLEQGSLIEMYGTVLSRNQFKVTEFIQFPLDSTQLDVDVYNQFISYYLNHLNRINYTTQVDENEEPVLKNPSNDFEVEWSTEATDANNTAQNISQDFDSW